MIVEDEDDSSLEQHDEEAGDNGDGRGSGVDQQVQLIDTVAVGLVLTSSSTMAAALQCTFGLF